MNKAKLETAMYEARRFLQKAEVLHGLKTHYYASKESGALRRASMDLTKNYQI